MTYEQLLDAADQEGLAVKEQPLSTHDGLIIGSHIVVLCQDLVQVKMRFSSS